MRSLTVKAGMGFDLPVDSSNPAKVVTPTDRKIEW
jgi:hypothetical protein